MRHCLTLGICPVSNLILSTIVQIDPTHSQMLNKKTITTLTQTTLLVDPQQTGRELSSHRAPFKSHARRAIAAAVAAVFLLSNTFAVAQGLPDLGDASSAVLSEAKEREIGSDVMRQIRADPAFRDDPDYVDYLAGIGRRLLAVSNDARYGSRDVEFFMIQDDSVNAFALLGGYVAIFTGLILTSENEQELIGVMAHEVSHLIQRHQARQQQESAKAMLAGLAGLAVAIAASQSKSSSASAITEAAIVGSQALQAQTMLNYSRDFEREADRVGFTLMEKAGYDTRGMASFFSRMQRSERFNDPGEKRYPGYLRTHPMSGERMADMQNRTGIIGNMILPTSAKTSTSPTTGTISGVPYSSANEPVLASSFDYQLIKARLLAEQGSPAEAVEKFKQRIAEQSIKRSRADAYGYAIALKRARQFDKALLELKQVRVGSSPASGPNVSGAWGNLSGSGTSKTINNNDSHPMIELALGETYREAGKIADALSTLKDASARYSDKRSIGIAYADTQAASGNPKGALVTINELARRYADNTPVRLAQARIADAAGNRVLAHRAQAEAYYQRGLVPQAINQLEQAIKLKNVDENEVGAAQTRLRVLRLEVEAEGRKKLGARAG